LFEQSLFARLIDTVKQIAKANLVTFRAQWDLQRIPTVYRCLVMIGATTAPLLGWWGSALMIDGLSNDQALGAVALGASAFIGSLAILGVTPVALSSLERMSDNCTIEHVFGKFTRKMITFNQEQLGDPTLAEQVKRVRERAIWRMMAMAKGQIQMVRNFGMLMITGVTVAIKAPELLPVLILFGMPSMLVELRHARSRSDLEEKISPIWVGLWGDLANLMLSPALAMLHQFGAAKWFALRYRKTLADASRSECRLEGEAAFNRVACALLVGVGLALSIVWLLAKTRSHEISVGEFVLISGAISGLTGCLAEFASILGQQWSQSKSINDLTDFLGNPVSEVVSIRHLSVSDEYQLPIAVVSDKVNQEDTSIHLRFDEVWLRYPSAPLDQYAVRELSFTVKRGSVVAVVGPNGAGKSSSMSMLVRQFQPTRGRILLNGTPIDSMTHEEFSSQLVMLPQQLRHFNLTLRELLNLGRPNDPATDKKLLSELERVGAAEIVRTWKNGLNTPLGLDRRGAVEPSGGQLQRLLLAAVVIAERGLIVLDEPVSMVDPKAAQQFWDALFAQKTDRTVIFSTHHLGAVQRANNILFIEDGRLAVQGTHKELMSTSAQYRELFEAQANDYR
jgi:ABC-type multidrug transport system fused ATPase/permease subunit